MNQIPTESLQQPVEAARPTGIARRRLLRAGLAAAPVVLAVSGRSAMAQTVSCSGLSDLTFNSLVQADGTCRVPSGPVSVARAIGEPPATWTPSSSGTLSRAWPAGILPYKNFPSNPPPAISSNPWEKGTLFQALFSGFTPYPESVSGIRAKSVSLILYHHPNTLEANLCVAYLNAKGVSPYAMTDAEVQAAFSGKIGTVEVNAVTMRAFLKQTWGG